MLLDIAKLAKGLRGQSITATSESIDSRLPSGNPNLLVDVDAQKNTPIQIIAQG